MRVDLLEGINNYLSTFKGKKINLTKYYRPNSKNEGLIVGKIDDLVKFEAIGARFISNIVATVDRIEMKDNSDKSGGWHFVVYFTESISLRVWDKTYNLTRSTQVPSVIDFIDEVILTPLTFKLKVGDKVRIMGGLVTIITKTEEDK